jgi:hypothetical protein
MNKFQQSIISKYKSVSSSSSFFLFFFFSSFFSFFFDGFNIRFRGSKKGGDAFITEEGSKGFTVISTFSGKAGFNKVVDISFIFSFFIISFFFIFFIIILSNSSCSFNGNGHGEGNKDKEEGGNQRGSHLNFKF